MTAILMIIYRTALSILLAGNRMIQILGRIIHFFITASKEPAIKAIIFGLKL